MFNRTVSRLVLPLLTLALTLTLWLGGTAAAMEGSDHHAAPSGNFQTIEQPLRLKAAVTVGALGLVGLELWWFLGSGQAPKGS